MAHLNLAFKSEMGLLTLVVDLAFQKGWITEIEQLQIKTKETVALKKSAFFEILTNTNCDENAARLLWSLRCIDEVKMEPTQYANGILDENYYKSIIMSELYTKGLVTKEQKLIYTNKENAVEKENHENSKNMDGITIHGEIEEFQNEDERNPAQSSTNPMVIDLVIRCVLQYLDFKEIKNARYISKVWSSIALDVLKTRSVITFNPISHSYPTDFSPLNFLSIFPTEIVEEVPFTYYNFRGLSKPWAIEELNYFFRNQQKDIKDLYFSGMYLVGENWHPIINYDISSWLQNSAMTKPYTKYNTRLGITTATPLVETSTMLFVQLSALVNIKELGLSGCRVDIQEGIVISPNQLDIKDVCFQRNGVKLTEICVNDIVDFSKTKIIGLTNSNRSWESGATKMILDMDGNFRIKLECLALKNITWKNIETCGWTVNHLHLDNVNFYEDSWMQVKELTIYSSQVNISNLPQSIQKLTMSMITQRNCLCIQPKVLQNLKAMKLHYSVDSKILEFLHSQKLKCPQLVELHLNDSGRTAPFRFREIKLRWIPETIKILYLKGVCIKDEPVGNNLYLDKLILSQYDFNQLKEICGTHIQTTNLIISNNDMLWNADHFLNFLNNQNICRGSNHRIYAARFYWSKYPENAFEESPLSRYVDMKSWYYVFEDNFGTAIYSEEFRKAMQCSFD